MKNLHIRVVGLLLLLLAGVLYFVGYRFWIGLLIIGGLVEMAGWMSLFSKQRESDP